MAITSFFSRHCIFAVGSAIICLSSLSETVFGETTIDAGAATKTFPNALGTSPSVYITSRYMEKSAVGEGSRRVILDYDVSVENTYTLTSHDSGDPPFWDGLYFLWRIIETDVWTNHDGKASTSSYSYYWTGPVESVETRIYGAKWHREYLETFIAGQPKPYETSDELMNADTYQLNVTTSLVQNGVVVKPPTTVTSDMTGTTAYYYYCRAGYAVSPAITYADATTTSATDMLKSWDQTSSYWTSLAFYDGFAPIAKLDSTATAVATLRKLQYKLVATINTPANISWAEVFTPIDPTQPKDYNYRNWIVPSGATESQVYTIDPLGIDPNDVYASHRHATQDGTYEVLVLEGNLAVDANRDGQIKLASDDASDQTSASLPYRFWLNDDDDSGDMGGSDIPDASNPNANCKDQVVNGTRDLVDFFPVFFDLKQLLSMLPTTTPGVKYKLKQADSALNFVYTNLTRDTTQTRDGALAYQKKILTTGFGDQFNKQPGVAATHQITAAGFELSSTFLTGVKDSDWGVLLIEGRAATTAPLVLSVEQGGTTIAEVKLELRISNVEAMFRHLNLRTNAVNYDGTANIPSDIGPPPRMTDPGDALPDSTTNGKYFVFVHGYDVDADHARGWQSELFKRLYQMGSRARFVGVSWYGSTGLDYHKAVFQAFQTGDVLESQLGLPVGADVTVAAHSLGNMVVSHAIQYGGLVPTRYYMINAAVPLEAYDNDNGSVTAQQRIDMTEHKWKAQDPSSIAFASNWHQLFTNLPSPPYAAGLPDCRRVLKWKNRFQGVLQIAHNFYSPGDDVVENLEWDNPSLILILMTQGFNLSRGAWVTQEFAKGANVVESGGAWVFSRVQGGWGQSIYYWPTDFPSPDQTREPYFGYFLEHDLFDQDSAKASTKAAQTLVQNDLLARGIPTLSYAAAVNRLAPLDDSVNPNLSRNFNMEAQGRTAGLWPTEGHSADIKSVGRWLHSDFKNVALPYVYQMYQEMINRGAL